MSYIGDFIAGVTLITKGFTTRAFATGTPTTLAGTPAVEIYKDDDGASPSQAGVSLAVDVGQTGRNVVSIDTSADGTFYAAGHDFHIVVKTGTVGGVSVVGEEVGHFSIQNRYTTVPPTVGAIADEVQTRTIARVTLVDTTTTNTDMRGTDGANTTTPPTVGAIADEVQTRTVARVTLVDTTTTNTDMRGTDGALTDKTGFALTTAYDAAKTASQFVAATDEVLANVKKINDVAITGDGSSGDKFDVV